MAEGARTGLASLVTGALGAVGIVFYVLVKAGAGRRREISWLMWVLAAVLVVAYALLPRLRH